MELITDKKKLIMLPHDIDLSCLNRIDQFCKLLSTKLDCHWMVSNQQQVYDVIIKNYNISNISKHNPDIPTIYLVYHETNKKTEPALKHRNMWYLHYPIYSHSLVPLLNHIAHSIDITATGQVKNGLATSFKERLSHFLRRPFKQKKSATDTLKEDQQIEKNVSAQYKQKKYINQLIKHFKPSEKLRAKVVFLGRPGSGKTTAIVGVSNRPALTTEVKASDHVSLLKNNTTIGIDYGEYHHEKINLKLYGTPGQQRYDYMRQLVINNVDAYVILIDLTSENPLAEVSYFNNIVRLNSGPNAIKLYVFTHTDLAQVKPDAMAQQIRAKAKEAIVTIMDPRDKLSVASVMDKLALTLAKNIPLQQSFDNKKQLCTNQSI